MRRLSAAIVVSVTSHAVALAWLVVSGNVLAVPLRDPPTRPTVPPIATGATAPSEPIALVLLDPRESRDESPVVLDDAAAQPRREPARPPARSPSQEARRDPSSGETILLGGTSRGEPPDKAGASGEPAGAPGRSPWMTMRRPEGPELKGLSQSFVDDFLSRSKPLAPAPDIPDERISNEIAEARRELRRGRGSLEQVVALLREREAEELKRSAGGTFTADKPTFTAKVDRDGQVHLEDKPWQLDTQDRLALSMGIDPYARNKLALLDRTRDQRVALGERRRHDQLARATELVQRNIDRLWSTARDLAERKRGLFELWDDCAETGSDELVAGGTAARAIVIGTIRARLRGGDAYTASELVQLNAIRRSKAVFAPYE
jgi:hypothetical protein